MRRTRRRVLGIVAVVSAVVVFWTPSLIATRYTHDAVPSSYVAHPLRGWHFLADAVRVSRRAVAGNEGYARGIAERYWWATRVDVTDVQLVYVDGQTVTIPVAAGGLKRKPADRTVQSRSRFAWFVSGTVASRPEQIVGVVDMRTGRILWDILRPQRSVGA